MAVMTVDVYSHCGFV